MTDESWAEYKMLLLKGREENREMIYKINRRVEIVEVELGIIKTKIVLVSIGLSLFFTTLGGLLAKMFGG